MDKQDPEPESVPRCVVAVAGVADERQRESGWACAISDGEGGLARIVSGSCGASGAHRAVLTAAAGALYNLEGPLELRTDSDCLGRWLVKWHLNGWRTQTGKPFIHRQLVETSAVLMVERDAIVVPAEGPDELLAAACAAAQQARSGRPTPTEIPPRSLDVSQAEEAARRSPTVQHKGIYRGLPSNAPRHSRGVNSDLKRTGKCPTCGAKHGEKCAKSPRPVAQVHPERLKANNIAFGLVPGFSAALSRAADRHAGRRGKPKGQQP